MFIDNERQFSFIERFIKGVGKINSWAGNCKFAPKTEGANIYLFYLQTNKTHPPTRLSLTRETSSVGKVHWRHVLFMGQKGRNRTYYWTRANAYHPTAEVSQIETTFLYTTVYKGERFEKERILDVRTHFKPTENFQYINLSQVVTQRALKKILSKKKFSAWKCS